MISPKNRITADEFEEELRADAHHHFMVQKETLKDYLFTIAKPNLDKEGVTIQYFLCVESYFYPLLFEYICNHSRSVDLHRMYNQEVIKKIKQYESWNLHEEEGKKIIIDNVIISHRDAEKLFFLDVRYLNRDEVEVCTIHPSYPHLFYPPTPLTRTISMQELCRCVIQLIILHDREMTGDVKSLIPKLHKICQDFVDKKRTKNKNRAKKLFSSINIKTFTNQIKENVRTTPFYKSRKWIRLSEFKASATDILINHFFSRGEIKTLRDLPDVQLSVQLKIMILHRMKSKKSYIGKHLSENLKCPISKIEIDQSNDDILLMLNRVCTLNKQEFSCLTVNIHKNLKRISGLSKADNQFLFNLTANRNVSLNKLGIIENQKSYNDKKSELIDFYVSAKQSGVTVSRIRKLLKAIYGNGEFSIHGLNLSNLEHHDFHLNIEPKIFSAFKNLSNSNPNTKGLNRFVDLFISEISGSDGDFAHAYKHIDVLTQISKAPEDLEKDFKSLNLLKAAILTGGYNLADLGLALKDFNCHESEFENIFNYASNQIILKDMMEHCLKLSKIKPKEYILKANPHVVSNTFDGFTVDVLPFNHPMGFIGASLTGVCIEFGDRNHLDHYGDAFANLIVRDGERILLWGLLVRVQNISDELYVLNNLQGRLSTFLSKRKHDVAESIRATLREFGGVLSLSFFFNSIHIIEAGAEVFDKEIYLPNIRLDVGDRKGFAPANCFYKV